MTLGYVTDNAGLAAYLLNLATRMDLIYVRESQKAFEEVVIGFDVER